MDRIQKIILLILLSVLLVIGLFKYVNESKSLEQARFWQPALMDLSKNSEDAFVHYDSTAAFNKVVYIELDSNCQKDMCRYKLINENHFYTKMKNTSGLYASYARTKKWSRNDIKILCKDVLSFPPKENDSISGFFQSKVYVDCPIMVRNRIDSLSYQKYILSFTPKGAFIKKMYQN